MNDLINMLFFITILILFIIYFKDINHKKVISLIKSANNK